MSEKSTSRLASLDALRGLLMVLMALDHASHFVGQQHSSGEYWGGPFPTYDAALPFLIRWITHLCAPGFFLLMGAGISLFAQARAPRGWGWRELARHFCLRGGALVALELLVVNPGWRLSPGGWSTQLYVGVLTALGLAMAVCGLLTRLAPGVLVTLSIAIAVATDLAMPAPAQWGQSYSIVVRPLLIPGGTRTLWANYPMLPWLSVALLGMAFGRWLHEDRARAFHRAVAVGLGFLAAFVVLRALDGFGNLRPRAGTTWIDWLNVVKYPPSITYLLLTLGLDLLLLGGLARVSDWRPHALRFLETYGRVPLFFYVTHLFVYAAMGHLLTPKGTDLGTMAGLWLVGLLVQFGPCLLYARLRHHPRWPPVLRYL